MPAGYEYRLPTDAEWEYTARAGEMATKGSADAPVLDPIAWFHGDSSEGYTGEAMETLTPEKQLPGGVAKPRAGATKRANAWGLYDLRGNKWEWCGDWYSPKLPGGSVQDPTGPAVGIITFAGGPGRVFRGGVRLWQLPGQRESALGFRIALAPQISR